MREQTPVLTRAKAQGKDKAVQEPQAQAATSLLQLFWINLPETGRPAAVKGDEILRFG